MNLPKKILVSCLVALLLVCSSFLHAQILSMSNDQGSFLSNVKPKVSVSLSSSFSSYAPGVTSFGTTIMPKITLPISDRLTLSTGIGYSSLFISNSNEGVFQSSPSNYGHVFVSGSYMLNEKISVRGTAYKTFLLDATSFGEMDSPAQYDFSSQGIIMDVEYRVTDNFRINVGFEYRDQKYPVYGPGMNTINPAMNQSSPFSGFNQHNSFNSF